MKGSPIKLPLQKRLPAYGMFLTVGAFIVLFILLASPSDSKNAALFGYSFERIVLGAVILLSGLALLFLTLSIFHRPELSQRLWVDLTRRGRIGDAIFLLSLLLFISGWVLIFTPSYRLGGLAGYVDGVSPIIGWLAVTGAATSLVILFERNDGSVRSSKTDAVVFKGGFICLGLLLLVALVMFITGLGYRQPTQYWFGAGVPVLGLQVLFSLFVGAVVLLLEKRLGVFSNRRFDHVVFILIWVVSAWFWGWSPLSPNYFLPDTGDNIIYPYSDGATFDVGGQYALIGQGLFNGYYFDRALYSVFLTYLHILFGQDFVLLMTVQAALLAVLPAVVYLIGRELHGRALGMAAGVLTALRGVNAIVAARWIDTASPKMILTDFPTAIGIAVFLLLFIKWIKHPSRTGILIWSGAAFALTLMVRTHALPLLPVALVFVYFVMKMRWKQLVLAGCLILLGLFTVTLPWEIRNQSRGIPMFYMYYSRIAVLLRYRYGIGGDSYNPPQKTEGIHLSRILSRQRMLERDSEPFCDSAPCFILNHFLHNSFMSFVSLPSSLEFDDILNTVKADTPYWKKTWSEGTVGTTGAALIFFNLALFSLGFGSLWKGSRSFALLPILLGLAYLLTNSIGLTSGGRYVAPVDWIVPIYFIAGGMQLVSWLLEKAGYVSEFDFQSGEDANPPSFDGNSYRGMLPVLGLILLVGSLLPASEMFFEPRYKVRQPLEILAGPEEAGLLEQTGYSREELMAFLSQPNAMIREGRALYPRYYRAGKGEMDRSTYFRPLDYQRLVFTLIGPYSGQSEGVVIPGNLPPSSLSLHTADVVVLGCWNTTYFAPFIDAVVVISTSDGGYVYNRAPGSPPECPLQTP